jgi:hypothetical protein
VVVDVGVAVRVGVTVLVRDKLKLIDGVSVGVVVDVGVCVLGGEFEGLSETVGVCVTATIGVSVIKIGVKKSLLLGEDDDSVGVVDIVGVGEYDKLVVGVTVLVGVIVGVDVRVVVTVGDGVDDGQITIIILSS